MIRPKRGVLNVVVLLLAAVAGGQAADAQLAEPDTAVSRLFSPPGTKLSTRLQSAMDRLEKEGVYGRELREMLARYSVDKTAEGALVRADRLNDPRDRVGAYEQILVEDVHRANLKYQLEILDLIRRESGRAQLSRDELVDLALRRAELRVQICEIERDGYRWSRPEENFARHVRDADRCLEQACRDLAQLGESCAEEPTGEQGGMVADRPTGVDPGGGQLEEIELFYISGVPTGGYVPIRQEPRTDAAEVARVDQAGRLSLSLTEERRTQQGRWLKVCTADRICGWIGGRHIAREADYDDAKRAIDGYLIGLLSSSIRGMLDLTTGSARSHLEKKLEEFPGASMRDISSVRPQRWDTRCASCADDVCQLLYEVHREGAASPDLQIFEARRDSDDKFRLAASRTYQGADRTWFDDLFPVCF